MYCTADELLFEFSESRARECSEDILWAGTGKYSGPSDWKKVFAGASVSTSDWQKVVAEYSQKDFTYYKDTLPALSGLANRLRGGGKYYAGAWEKEMTLSSMWYAILETACGP